MPGKTMTEENTLFLVLWVCAVALTYMCFAVAAQSTEPPKFRLSTYPPLPPAKIKCTRPAMSVGVGPEVITCEFNERKFIIEMETK